MGKYDGLGRKLEESDSELIVRISLEDEGVRSMIGRAYEDLLSCYDYNVSALIRYLKIPRQSFYNKMKKYGINLEKVRRRGSRNS